MLAEIVQLRQGHGVHGGGGLGGGLTELGVAGLQLLDALDVGGELIRRPDQLLDLRVGGTEGVLVGGTQVLRQHGQELVLRHLLHGLVGLADTGIVILDRGGHIAGEDLAGVVVQRRHGHSADVHLAAEALIPQHRQRVGQHRCLVAVLLDILRVAVPHERPALDEAHTVDIGEKVVHVMSTLLSVHHHLYRLFLYR